MTIASSAASPDVNDEAFVISRVLDASRGRVWQAFSEAERLAQWRGPVGCTIDVKKLDFRPGGEFHYRMNSAMGEMWGKFMYREISAPERIVFTNSFSNEAGELTRPPWTNLWPLLVLNTLTLTEVAGKTTLSLRGIPVDATEEERAAFVAMKDSMRQGFGGTWDQLAAYLARSA
jgi:uncharacterized protein YndB with AHSA1/START domain